MASLGSTAAIPEDVESVVAYGDLSGDDRRTVDRALAGERVVVRDPADLPGPRKTKGKLAVRRDGDVYLVTRRIFFNWRTTYGVASLAAGLDGLVTVSESVRRRHFPDRPVYRIRR